MMLYSAEIERAVGRSNRHDRLQMSILSVQGGIDCLGRQTSSTSKGNPLQCYYPVLPPVLSNPCTRTLSLLDASIWPAIRLTQTHIQTNTKNSISCIEDRAAQLQPYSLPTILNSTKSGVMQNRVINYYEERQSVVQLTCSPYMFTFLSCSGVPNILPSQCYCRVTVCFLQGHIITWWHAD